MASRRPPGQGAHHTLWIDTQSQRHGLDRLGAHQQGDELIVRSCALGFDAVTDDSTDRTRAWAAWTAVCRAATTAIDALGGPCAGQGPRIGHAR